MKGAVSYRHWGAGEKKENMKDNIIFIGMPAVGKNVTFPSGDRMIRFEDIKKNRTKLACPL